MTYEYFCEKCQMVLEAEFSFGKAPKEIICDCGTTCGRHYGDMNFILKGGGWPSKKMSFNKEMTDRNEAAGQRMRKTWDGTQPKLKEQ